MKSIDIANIGVLKNELRKYKLGKKLEISEFNQAARLAWLGRIVLSPLDPEDPECRAWLLLLEHPDGLAGELLELDVKLIGRIHILDGEQGERLGEILREGFEVRARELDALSRRDFYLGKFFHPKDSG
mgnify:FL=1